MFYQPLQHPSSVTAATPAPLVSSSLHPRIPRTDTNGDPLLGTYALPALPPPKLVVKLKLMSARFGWRSSMSTQELAVPVTITSLS